MKSLRYKLSGKNIENTNGTIICVKIILYYIYIYIWRFPEIGIPLNHPCYFRIFHYKPSSYRGPVVAVVVGGKTTKKLRKIMGYVGTRKFDLSGWFSPLLGNRKGQLSNTEYPEILLATMALPISIQHNPTISVVICAAYSNFHKKIRVVETRT